MDIRHFRSELEGQIVQDKCSLPIREAARTVAWAQVATLEMEAMMNGIFRIAPPDQGPPQAVIPNQYLWDFVEYLAFQRIHVIYTYRDEHFTVSFPSVDHQEVQRLLDEWSTCATRSLSGAV